ncbi:MAG: hypothetical protein IPP32_15545 [Bacteroidetes bacterium]|nr:hypothetical protein [Bacteroidota bacterium]
MDSFATMLMYTVPSLIVFLTSYFILKSFMDNEYKSKLADIRMNNQTTITPIRLQACERIVLFCERIAINNLVMRVHRQGMSARLLHSELLTTIRNEYEHNISQQIYVSKAAWDAVKNAKEETIKAINISASKVADDATGLDLCTVILDLSTKVAKLPTDYAIEVMKAEIRQIF